MKNLINSGELDQTIEKLDNLLTEGYLKYKTQRQGYIQNKNKEGFSVDTYRQETINILNEWFIVVVQIIEAEIKEKHHLFHFLQHHGGSPTFTHFELIL